jgi:hypothetical protein
MRKFEERRPHGCGAVYFLCEPTFGGTFRLHLHSSSVADFFYPEDGVDSFIRKLGSQKKKTG